eukprot:CAMPEP_0170523842 /NCGR_PEP_ID=MMETSP0209-20121228/9280_1 /TAXON_ID=665100 ORGANISM="Litonotus pictus, Strain P1" /NCGR_SAMPLE_ID=MMETSP0209 /ASSEMBLY_ACC=CAM_ASM_000301 /LENGTH=334 /DNA_ID=CAMNT_0010812173 /DNA_START=240 /DNA_END=1241 /DNA_ORIENTATION=+
MVKRMVKVDLLDYDSSEPYSDVREEVEFTMNSGTHQYILHFINIDSTGQQPFNLKAASSDVTIKDTTVLHNCMERNPQDNSSLLFDSAYQQNYFCVKTEFKLVDIQKDLSKKARITYSYKTFLSLERDTYGYNNENAFSIVYLGSLYKYPIRFIYEMTIETNKIKELFTAKDLLLFDDGKKIKVSELEKTLRRKGFREDISKQRDRQKKSSKAGDKQTEKNTEEKVKIYVLKINIDEVISKKFVLFHFEINSPKLNDLIKDDREEHSDKENLYSILHIAFWAGLTAFFVYMLNYIYFNDVDKFVMMSLSEEVEYIKSTNDAGSSYSESSNGSLE